MIPWLTSALFLSGAFTVAYLLWRKPVNRVPARYALLSWLAIGGLSQIFVIAPVYRAFDTAVGHANTAIVVSHSLGLIAAAIAEIMYVHWTHEPEQVPAASRRRFLIMMLPVAAMILLFATSPEFAESPDGWRIDNAGHGTVACYSIVFAAALSWSLLDLARLSLRYSRRVSHYTRLGLQFLAAGSAVGLLYTGLAAVDGLLGLAGLRLPEHKAISYALSLGSILGIVLGAIIPGTATASIEALKRSRQAWLCAQMEPLYSALIDIWPGIAQSDPVYGTRGWITNWLGNGRKLAQRTIEIRDGLHRLTSWLDEQTPRVAVEHALRADLSAQQIPIFAEAAQIADAVAAKRRDAAPVRTGALQVDVTQDSEAAWLAAVSQVFATSPLIDEVLRDMHRRRTPQPAGEADR